MLTNKQKVNKKTKNTTVVKFVNPKAFDIKRISNCSRGSDKDVTKKLVRLKVVEIWKIRPNIKEPEKYVYMRVRTKKKNKRENTIRKIKLKKHFRKIAAVRIKQGKVYYKNSTIINKVLC
jgi:hypothetical protein